MRVLRLTVFLAATLAAAPAVAQPGVPPMQPPPPPPQPPAAQPAPPAPPAAQPPPAPAQPPPPPAAQPPAPPAAQPPAAQPPAPPPQPPPPPEPPPPAVAPPATEPPPPLAPLPPPAPAEPEVEHALAGWHGSFFLRDPGDHFRLYPRGRLHVDFNTFFGPGVHDVPAADNGNLLKSRLYIKRIRLELAGEFLERFQFLAGVDFGGQTLANANGKTETAAGAAGSDPTASSARFAGVQTPTLSPSIADTYINYKLMPELNFLFGQENTPFSMEARTGDNTTTAPERHLPIRSFVVGSPKETMLEIWGDIGKNKLLMYEVAISGGDGQNRPQVDNRVDFIGRVVVRPLSAMKNIVDKLQVGVSARHGERDPDYVGYDYPQITSGQGWVLWDPRYRDSASRVVHIIPSGAQNAIGGELRVPIKMIDLRGEAYYVANRTREAVDGFQLTNTERLGAVTGVGWYVLVGAWPFGDAFVTGDPGVTRPTHVDFTKKPALEKGLEVYALVGGVDASYDGASRRGAYDVNTPGAAGVASDITVRQYGLGANYWYTKLVRATVSYNLYHVPGSASADNLALAPGNASVLEDAREAHYHHELGTRLGVQF